MDVVFEVVMGSFVPVCSAGSKLKVFVAGLQGGRVEAVVVAVVVREVAVNRS